MNRGLPNDVTILQAIAADGAKFYKAVQPHLAQTKTKPYDSWVIDILTLKSNTMTNLTQLSGCLQRVKSTLDESTSFDGFALFIFMVK